MRGQLNSCERTLPDGIYRIATVYNIDFNIGVKDNSEDEDAYIKLYPRDINNESQLFLVEYLPNLHAQGGGNNYRIKNVHSKKYLRPYGDSPWSVSYDIVQSTNDQNGARWIIEDGGNGTYRIRSATGNYCIDLNNGNVASGEQIHTWDGSMGKTQQWVFVPVDPVTSFPDGDYMIRSAKSFSYGVDLRKGDDADKNNVLLWTGKDEEKSQKWSLKNIGGGYYTFTNLNSGKVLNVDGGRYTGTPNVQQYDNDETDACKWMLKEAGGGAFYIVNKRGLFLDIADNGTMTDGKNIDAFRGNSQEYQKWYLVATNSKQTIPNGDYEIRSKKDNNFLLQVASTSSDNGVTVNIDKSNGGQNQRWRVTFEGNGYYTLRPKHSDSYLNVAGNNWTQETDVRQWNADQNSAGSAYIIREASNGYFYIINKNGLFVDISAGNMAQSQNVQGWVGNSSEAQQWNFVRINPIEDGCYYIRSAKHLDYVMEVEQQSAENGALIEIHTKNDGSDQKWVVKYLGDGFYNLASANSFKFLDVDGGKTNDGTKIQQWRVNEAGNNNNKWAIRENNEGFYNIINHNGVYLDVTNAKFEDGTKLQAHHGNGNEAQMWVFDPTSVVDVYRNESRIGGAATVNDAIALAGGQNADLKLLSNANAGGFNVSIFANTAGVTLDLNGNKLFVDGKSANISGNDNVTILLKDDGFTSYTNECQVTGSPVKYERNFASTTRAGKWQALYLPFKAEAPSGYEFGSPKRGSVSQSSAKLVFEKGVTSLDAKKYYFVRSSDGKVTITQQNATLLPYTTPEQEAYAEGSNLGIKGSLHNDDNVAEADKAFWVLTNGGKFTWAKAGSHQRPYHWVIYVPNNSIAALNLLEEDDEETALEDIEAMDEESNEPIYTIGGVRVNGTNLTPGIYIRGGKKFIVR